MILSPLITDLAEAVTSIVFSSAVLKGFYDTIKSLLHERTISLLRRSAIVTSDAKEKNIQNAIELIDKLLYENEKMKAETVELRMHVEQMQNSQSSQQA